MPLVPLQPFKTPRKVAAAQVVQMQNNPPPTGGLNLRDPISNMAPNDAIILDNFIARQQGVELRKGWKYFTDPEEGVTEFKSVFAYNVDASPNRKIFAAFDGDIYDVTTGTPTLVVNNTGSTTDQWWTVQFSTPARSYLLAVSPGAGYWTYDSVGGWVNRTAGTVGLPSNVRTVSVWKRRVWFTCVDDPQVYYMRAVDAIQGHADPFPMGSVLRNGGSVSAVLNWTVDGGASIDDYMVVIGTEGDIGLWEGTDPTSVNTFALKGVWYIGPVPKYGVYFTPFGGDVMILSVQGLIPLSKLISGQYNEMASQAMPSSKIQPAITPLLSELLTAQSWGVFAVPKESIIILKVPMDSYGQYRQFVMNTVTGAWSTFSNMPMLAATLLDGQMYFSTPDGRIAKGLFGNYDAVETDGTGSDAVEGDVQPAFNPYGTPANLKQFSMTRPIFLAKDAPSVKLVLNTQYAFDNVAGSPSFTGPTTSVWDTSSWNSAYFAGISGTYQAWVGVSGLGYYGSLRMKVRGLPGTLFTSAHVMYQVGGIM